MAKTNKESTIEIKIKLDDQNLPEQIEWKAPEGGQTKPSECKAMLVAFFDKQTKETQKIDLWTKDMQVVEMDRFFFQTLRAMADTYFKATQNAQLATDMQRFVQYFGEQTEIISKS